MDLKIGNIDHKIIKRKKIEDEGANCIGLIDHDQATIYIKKNLPLQVERQTLIHEVMHGIMIASGFDFDDGIHTEDTVNRLGLTLEGFLRDNIDTLNKLYKGDK